MSFNWLDAVLIAILVVTFVLGVIKGLLRQIIGILAVIIGLILAVSLYSQVSDLYKRFISHEVVSHLLGFLTIFVCILCLGWLFSHFLSKLMKGPLKFMNHVLGGGIGLLKGVLICGVVVFALLVFPVNKKALRESRLAPYCFKITKAAVSLIPQELKEKFRDTYNEITRKGEDGGNKI